MDNRIADFAIRSVAASRCRAGGIGKKSAALKKSINMKNLVIGISICIAVLSTLLLTQKNREVAVAREQAVLAEAERRAAFARQAELDAKSRDLKNRLHASFDEAGEK